MSSILQRTTDHGTPRDAYKNNGDTGDQSNRRLSHGHQKLLLPILGSSAREEFLPLRRGRKSKDTGMLTGLGAECESLLIQGVQPRGIQHKQRGR